MTISELARNLEVLSRCHDLPRDDYESGDNSPDELSPSTITEIARNVTRPESWDIAPQPVTEALVKAVRCACRRLISSYAGFRTWQAHEAASFLHQIEMLIHDVHADRSIPVHIALLGAGFGKLSRTVGEPSVAHAAIEHLLSQDPAVVNGPLLKALAVSELVHDWHGAWYAIENDPDRPVAWNAAQALILLANAQNRPLEVPLVFEVLTEALDAGYEYGFDADVVFLFIKAGPVCITFAEKVLWSDNCHISYQGVEILSHFSQRSNAEATKALIEFVNRRPHDYAFPYAAGALANNPDPDAQLALLQAWVNDDHYERNCRGESWYTRRYFAEKFGETLVEKIIDTGASSSSVLARLNEVADFQIGQLIPLVRHPNANVQATLAEIVSSRREEPECQVIITALASDPDPRVREMLLAE